METGCDPSLLLNHPPLFRHVCPLLKPNAAGNWLCSVDSKDVRPFWGRAVGFFAGALLAFYLIATLAAFSFLRIRGYPISYYDIAWPPAWSHFRAIQSRYFAQKASQALAKRDPSEAVMALSIAYQLDRSNFSIGMLFARLTQVSQPALSDQVYQQLAQDHPTHRIEIYAAWYEALLWRADFTSIVELARQALALDAQHQPAWINAILFALRREPDPRLLRDLADNTSGESRAVFRLELQTAAGGPSTRDALLEAAQTKERPAFFSYYIPRRLIELGFAKDALDQLTRDGALPVRDRIALRLEALEKLGAHETIREQVSALLKQPMNSVTSQLLSGFFVRHSEPDLFATTFDAFKSGPAAQGDAAYAEWAGWLCAAGANADFVRYDEASSAMRKISGSEFRAAEPLKHFFRGDGASARIESYLASVQPLPLDVTYALLERYYLPRNQRAVLKP